MGGDGIPTAFDARKLRASARSEERTSFESYSCQKTNKKNPSGYDGFFLLVGGDGFEPSKRDATDLQSAPFGHSGTLPYEVVLVQAVKLMIGAGGRIRTPDLLITNQLLYRLSYTSISSTQSILSYPARFVNHVTRLFI